MNRIQFILPKTPMQLFLENIYEMITFVNGEYSFSVSVYRFVHFFTMATTFLTFLDFHEDGTGYHQFELVLNLFGTGVTQGWVLANFLINAIYIALFFIYLIISCVIYQKRKYLSLFHIKTTLFLSEVAMPIVYYPTASFLGNCLHHITLDPTSVRAWVFALLALLAGFIFFFFTKIVLYNSIPFVDGRVLSYAPEVSTLAALILFIARAFGRALELSQTSLLRCVFGFLALFFLIIWFLLIYKSNGFIHPFITNSCLAMCSGAMVICVISIFIRIDWALKLILFGIILIVTYFIYSPLHNRRTQKIIDAFDRIMSDETDFETEFPTQGFSFILAIYEGFRCGNPYVLTFKPLQIAISENSNSQLLWRTYLRILSVYNSRSFELINSLEEIQKMNFTDYQTTMFIKGIKHLVETRAREITRECRSTLKRIDSQTRQLRGTLVKYWQSVQNSEEGGVFTYGNKANIEMSQIESLYEQTIKNWPNVSYLYERYATFLRSVCYDKIKADYMHKCSTQNHSFDFAEISAKIMFILLPISLPDDGNIAIYNNNNNKNDMTSQGVSTFNFEDDDNEDEDQAASLSLLATGRNAPVPINSAISIIMIFIFICLFCFGVLTTAILVVDNYNVFNNLLTFMSSFTSLLLYMPRACYNIVSDGIEILGLSYTDQEMNDILGIPETALPKAPSVLSDIKGMTHSIDKYINMISDTMEYTDNVSRLIRTLEVKQNHLIINDTTGKIVGDKYFTLFQNAMNSINGFFSQYTKAPILSAVDISYEYWYLFVMENTYRVCDLIMEFATYIASDMLNYADQILTLAQTMAIVFCSLCALSIPAILYMLYVQRKQYSNVVKAMSKIPKIVIIQHISEMTKNKSNEKDDMKSETLFAVQDIAGIPNVQITLWLVLNCCIFIAECLANFFLLTMNDRSFRALPFQMKNTASLMNSFYDQLGVIKRITAINEGHPISIDGPVLYRIFNEARESIFQKSDNVFFGEEEGVEYGYVHEQSVNREILFRRGETDWSNIHGLYTMFPPAVTLEIISSEMQYLNRSSNNVTVFGKDSFRLNHLIHYTSTHLCTEFLNSIVVGSTQDMATIISNQTIVATLGPIVMIIIQVLCMIPFIYLQRKVLTTFRFTLMSLGMLDQKFIQTNEKLMSIAGGNFSPEGQSESVPQHYVSCINDKSEDMIINTTKSFEIMSTNASAQNLPRFTNNVRTLAEIIDIPEEAKIVANSSKPIQIVTQNKFKDKEGIEYSMTINIYQSSHQDLYFIMHREKQMEIFEEEKSKKKDTIVNIMNRVLPHDLRQTFINDPFKPVTMENIIILSVRLQNFAITDDNGIEATLSRMTDFNNIIINASKQADDCAISKKHNTTTFLLFNIKNQTRQIKTTLQDIIRFVKTVKTSCDEQNIEVSFAMNFSRIITLGCLSQNRAAFNIYCPELYLNYNMSRISNKDEIVFHKLVNELPDGMKEKIIQVDIANVDNAHKIFVSDFV